MDQLAEVGFEMVFYSFGSGFNLEAEDISGLKADIAYANSKGKALGMIRLDFNPKYPLPIFDCRFRSWGLRFDSLDKKS